MSQATPQPAAPAAKSSALYKFALLWAALATLIPTVFGVILVTNPGGMLTPGATDLDVMRGMGLRNFAFSLMLGVALFTQPKRVVAFLLAARGLTEWADALSGVFAGSRVIPFVGGLGDLLFAWYLYRFHRAPEAK